MHFYVTFARRYGSFYTPPPQANKAMKKIITLLLIITLSVPTLRALSIEERYALEEMQNELKSPPKKAYFPAFNKKSKGNVGRPIFVIRKRPDVWLPWDLKRKHSFQFTIKANLLRWATLTPDLGVEYRICRDLGVGIQASYTSWSWKSHDRRYAVLDVMPHLRWYLGKDYKGYIGVMAQGGSYNYKLKKNAEGIQGDFIGGGLMGGYNLPIGKNLMLDFCLGVGYLRTRYEKYIDIFRYEKGYKNYIGPTHLSVSLVYTFSFDK